VHRELVGHDSFIPSCSEDGGGVDLQKLGGVDTPVVFLRQVGPELVQPDHHAEVWAKRHAAIPRSRWHSMVMQSSSPERRRSSSACKSAVARLAAGACAANSTCGAIEVRECATDDTGMPPE
jgi:hypothetical protein